MTDVSYENAARPGSTTADLEALKQKAAIAKDAAVDLAGEAKRFALHRASDAKDTAGEWVQSAKSKAADYVESTTDFVQRHPYKSLAIAAGIGLVIGMIIKRR